MKELKVKSEKLKVQNAKRSEGITLVALIITVIVLLILAAVSIRLVMNGGIIDRAERGTQAYTEAEIGEQIKLAYSEYKMGQFDGSTETSEKVLGDRLKGSLGDENLTVNVKNDKVVVNTTVNSEPKTYIYKAKTGESYEYKDPFDYGTKTKETLVPGDDITLGTEKFRVFYNQDGVIKAMPWYNLVTVTADGTVKQGPAVSGISTVITSAFSTENYWKDFTQNHKEVDMDDSRNIIKKYITAYEKELENLKADLIQVRNANYTELNQEDVTNSMRNPGQNGSFWLDTSYASGGNWIHRITNGGAIDYDGYYGKRQVRPIIIIEY